MTKHMFAPAAVACLKDGRAPRPEEIEQLAAKIWQDAYGASKAMQWADVQPGTRMHAAINAAALTALGALASFGPDVLQAGF